MKLDMRKIISFMHISLDSDTALYGRVIYQMMENYWPTAADKPTATYSLIQLNLIDSYWLFVNPIILGQGIPLFVDIKDKIKLKLLPTTRQFACGVTELNYIVDRK